MAEKYLKATGDWNNNATWSATDGGAGGASFPTASDNVHFTANGDGLTLTVNVASACINFVADEVNTATVDGAGVIAISGNLTLHANMTWSHTGTIKITGTGAFSSQGKTFNNVELNGTAHTISGDGLAAKSIKVGRATAVTITGTAGETYTVESFYATDNTNVLTMNSTGAAWTLTGNSGYCELDYTDITNVTAGWKYIYYAGDNSTDSGGNTDWIFTRKVRQQMFPRR